MNLGFIHRRELEPARAMYKILFEVLQIMKSISDSIGAEFMLIYFSQRIQVHPSDWETVRREWNLRAEDCDLLKHNRMLASYSNEIGIKFCDVTPHLIGRDVQGGLFLPGDDHYSSTGSYLAAVAVARCLLSTGILSPEQ